MVSGVSDVSIAPTSATVQVNGGTQLFVPTVNNPGSAGFRLLETGDFRLLQTGAPPGRRVLETPGTITGSVVSLMHFEDGNGSTAFTDSASGRVWTASSTAAESTAQSKFGSGSGFFGSNAAAMYISTPVSSGDALDLTKVDFCAECWAYRPANSQGALMDFRGPGSGVLFALTVDNNRTVNLFWWQNGSFFGSIQSAAGVFTLNTWHHVAVVVRGNLATLYVDGAASFNAGSGSTSMAGLVHTDKLPANYFVYVGGSPVAASNNGGFNGYIDDFRITVGGQVYGGWDFTPPTSALTADPVATTGTVVALLNFDDGANTYVDSCATPQTYTGNGIHIMESTTRAKFGTGSLYNDTGAGSLSTTQNQGGQLDFRAVDHTVEYWVYPTTYSVPQGSQTHIDWTGGNVSGHRLYMVSNGAMVAQSAGLGYGSDPSTQAILMLGAWNHIAFVQLGSSALLFLNGQLTGSSTSAYSNFRSIPQLPSSGGKMYVASNYVPAFGGGLLNGYIDNLSITVGLAKYGSAFTPPPAPQLPGGTPKYSDTSVSWSVNGVGGGNPTLGTIGGAGLYVAPTGVTTLPELSVTVAAALNADPTQNASALVTLGLGQFTVYGKCAFGAQNASGVIPSQPPASLGAFPPVMIAKAGTINPKIYMPQEATKVSA